MIVAGLQTDIAWEDPAENFRRVDALAVRAVGAGAHLLVLPEMFATGFSMDAHRVSRDADRIRDYLADLARRYWVWVLGGYAEEGGVPGCAVAVPDRSGGTAAAENPAGGCSGQDRLPERDAAAEARPEAESVPGPAQAVSYLPRNACALFAPDGSEALRYHKLHPFSLAGEHERYAGGTQVLTAEVEGLRVTPLICYDLRFPEPFRIAAAETDLFVVIASWPSPRRHAWRTLLLARAMENQAFVLGVNRVGEGDGQVYTGDSALVDPLGEMIASATGQPALVVGDVDPSTVAAVRAQYSFLADRRPDVYAAIAVRRQGTP